MEIKKNVFLFSVLLYRLDRDEKYWKLMLHECSSSSSVQLVITSLLYYVIHLCVIINFF